MRDAGLKVCSGGIVGMGESRKNRAAMLVQLANLEKAPESGADQQPGADSRHADGRCRPPRSLRVRPHHRRRPHHHADFLGPPLGRPPGNDRRTAGALFLAGANSMFYGDKLLTTGNPDVERDEALFERLGLTPVMAEAGFVDRKPGSTKLARVAARYGEGDFFAREIDRRMQERLDYVRIAPTRLEDLGCSRGSLPALGRRYPETLALASIWCRDAGPDRLSPSGLAPLARFLAVPEGPLLAAADACRLPLRSESQGLVWSTCSCIGSTTLPVLAEAHRVEVGGLQHVFHPGAGQLQGTARRLCRRLRPHPAHHRHARSGDMLVACGFADPVMDRKC